ncbi:peptidase C14 [Armillaria luteobubalina]|uniref:Peptidase C14 n=1 Tax=Armillaria luteobubalina TaxID=153913 RepID=A0AA39QM23_9AGAR|nr:peptidase C14 [Armillaria luteobubalina]
MSASTVLNLELTNIGDSIGINYTHRREYPQVHQQLSGCVKDALQIRESLSEHWVSSIQGSKGALEMKVLRDDSKKTDQIPSKKNIIKAMRWLVDDACPEDLLVFHYSGHGSQIPDKNSDEPDGYDEVIYPIDGGYILDDDMHELMVKPLPPGCRLTVHFVQAVMTAYLTSVLLYKALFDCCHSGSALDLPYVWHNYGGLFRGGSVMSKWIRCKSTEAGVISLSSSKNIHMSMDTPGGGAMSDAFIMSLKHDAYLTYDKFFDSIK